MNWYIIDKDYVEYLKKYDSRVGYVDYGEKLKLHIGVLVEVLGTKYYVPVSSAKEKHNKMKNSLDFHKIIGVKDKTFYAVVNLNNMIPVPDHCVTKLNYNELHNYRHFKDEKEKQNYIYLLQKEKAAIDSIEDVLHEKAKRLLAKVALHPHSQLAKRCCDFSYLREKANDYKKITLK